MATEKQCALVLGLFETCYDRVFGFVRKYADRDTCEEVAQEVFFRLLSLQDLETKELSVSYLIKIADNLLKRRYRRLERWKRACDELSRDALPGNWAMAARIASTEDDQASVSDAMDQLSGDERDAIRLIICEGLSYEDAARSLGVEVSTVNNWKHRGIKKLKQHVGTERGRPGESTGERRGRARQRALPEGAHRRDAGHEAND